MPFPSSPSDRRNNQKPEESIIVIINVILRIRGENLREIRAQRIPARQTTGREYIRNCIPILPEEMDTSRRKNVPVRKARISKKAPQRSKAGLRLKNNHHTPKATLPRNPPNTETIIASGRKSGMMNQSNHCRVTIRTPGHRDRGLDFAFLTGFSGGVFFCELIEIFFI